MLIEALIVSVQCSEITGFCLGLKRIFMVLYPFSFGMFLTVHNPFKELFQFSCMQDLLLKSSRTAHVHFRQILRRTLREWAAMSINKPYVIF